MSGDFVVEVENHRKTLSLRGENMEVELKYMRNAKAKRMSSLFCEGIKIYDDLRVEEYYGGIILPGRISNEETADRSLLGGVIDENGKYIESSGDSTFVGGNYEVNTFVESKKTVVYCGYFKHHWGHFLVDNVPRLWYVLEKSEVVDEYVMINLQGEKSVISGNIMEFFELLGISNKVRILSEPTRFNCIIIPQLAYKRTNFFNKCKEEKYFSKKYIQIFNRIVENALKESNKERIDKRNIFLTRSELIFSKERDCGIEMIDSFFRNNNYFIISPEKMSLKKFICVINCCVNFACIQGTLQHNLLFVKDVDNVIVVERSPYINSTQTEIHIMKQFNTTFIDANGFILPAHVGFGPFIYSYNDYLKEYIRDMKLNSPNYQYITEEYRNNTVIKYLKEYQIPLQPWTEEYEKEYVLEAGNECIKELYPKFNFTLYRSIIDLKNKYLLKQKVMKYLMEYNLAYSKWKHIDLYEGFKKTIENAIDCGKTEFIIYPFGKNGLLFKQILNEQYGIIEKAIFDNKLCKYNNKIKSLSEINDIYYSRVCLVLTSYKIECRAELLKYCEMDKIEGPFVL